jgi:DNA-binding NarL/FixJ family response regulator
VLIVDYDPGRGDALALCRRVKARPDTPFVLIYTAYSSAALAVAARAAQADGLVDKSQPAPMLISAIRRIAHGERVIPKVSRGDFEAAVARLDDTDLPIFAMLLDGAPVPAIAEELQTDEREAAHRAQKVVARLRPRLDRQLPRVG